MKNIDLFGNANSSATFSECRKYRYNLFRYWDRTKHFIVFIGLNPSTANEDTDDPTIRRVKNLAASWGYGGICMMNLFAYISAYPTDLKKVSDPVGENDAFLNIAKDLNVDVVFAWGNFDVFGRDKKVIEMFPNAYCLYINKNGTPKHPLYCAANTQLIKFK